MSERYTKLFSLPENLYSAGAPVIVSAGALQKDNQADKIFAQLKLHNIQDKVIKALTVTLSLMDTAGKPLADTDFQYLDLTAGRETDFGQKTPVPLEEANTRAFSVKVKEVIYADNTTWTDTGAAWEPLAPARTLDDALEDTELVKQFRLDYGPKCKYEIKRDKDLWRCSCGAYNREDEAACASCGLTAEKLENADLEALAANKDERLVREKAEAEEHDKKIKKLTIIGVAAVVVVIAAVVGISKIINARQVNEDFALAAQYIADGDTESATDIYDRLIEENDTPEMRYHVAEAYYENGLSFAKALNVLDSIGNYKGSAELKAKMEPYLSYVGTFRCTTNNEMYIVSDFIMRDGKVFWSPDCNIQISGHVLMQNEMEVSDTMEATETWKSGDSFTIEYTFADGKISYVANVVNRFNENIHTHISI